MSGLRKRLPGADIRITHREGGLKGAIFSPSVIVVKASIGWQNAGAGIIKLALLAFCERRGYAPVSIATLSRIIADDKDKMRTAPFAPKPSG